MNVYSDPWLIAANKAIMDARPAPDVPVGLPDTPDVTATRLRLLEDAILAPHGTPSAYRRHLRHDEPVCQMCEIANRATWTAEKAARRRALRRAAA